MKFPRPTHLVIVFACEEDARRVLEVLPKRLARFGLMLHPEKTRLIRFERPAMDGDGGSRDRHTFSFLGFTHYWARSRKGAWVVKRKTASDRFTRALRKVVDWIRTHRHWRVRAQHKALCAKLRGHYGFYGITGNSRAIARFAYEAKRAWRKWLDRRSQNTRMPWKAFVKLLRRHPLPPPRIIQRAANP